MATKVEVAENSGLLVSFTSDESERTLQERFQEALSGPESGSYCVTCSFYDKTVNFQFNKEKDFSLGYAATNACIPFNGSGFYMNIKLGKCK
jgi:hypothetical protein